MKKIVLGIALGVVAVALMVCAGVGIAMAKSTMKKLDSMQDLCQSMENGVGDLQDKNKELLAYVDEVKAEAEKGDEAEFVTIAGQYEIRDTSAISDAYKSGNTDGLTANEKETLKLAEKVLNEVTKPEMSNYEKELAIFTWIKKNVKHDEGALLAVVDPNVNTYTPYGVLMGKQAVCVGYATTFKLFMNMIGLDCMVMHNTDLYHSWDLVKLDDGEWYLCDLYMDGCGTTPTYNNFNCNSTQFLSGHDWDQDLYPVANGIKYNYANMNAKESTIEQMLAKIKAQMKVKKTNAAYYRLPAGTDAKYISQLASGIQERMNGRIGEGNFETNLTVDENGRYILGALFNYYEYEEPSETQLDADLEKLLNDTFGEVKSDYDHYEEDYCG